MSHFQVGGTGPSSRGYVVVEKRGHKRLVILRYFFFDCQLAYPPLHHEAGSQRKETLDELEQAMKEWSSEALSGGFQDDGRAFGLVVGAPGSGKSALLDLFAKRRLKVGHVTIVVTFNAVTDIEQSKTTLPYSELLTRLLFS